MKLSKQFSSRGQGKRRIKCLKENSCTEEDSSNEDIKFLADGSIIFLFQSENFEIHFHSL